MCSPVRPSRARALMSSYTPPPPKVVDGWQPETEDQSQGFSSSSGAASFGIIMGGLIVLVIVLLVIVWLIFYTKQRLRDKERNPKVGPSAGNTENPPPTSRVMPKTFNYDKLRAATKNFSEDRFLGEVGFGKIYKGYLEDGKIVAIKQQIAEREQGVRQFLKEILIISGIHHKHLAHVFGYCISETQKLLVYDFVPNKSLHFHSHGMSFL
ncbi:proline-rich receptor-like protein kinase PERK3 [Pistacia vera]|uniref:proline-rich receptor-like protein kinase PERK3 n=1 Tax=Pistacia vera TaxID=55513 RepID=UPI0012634043|nr:proline-rich receptor-like protein kinase PERK3 [Pistacia vera]